MKTSLEAIHYLRTLANDISSTLDILARQFSKEHTEPDNCEHTEPDNCPKVVVIQQTVSNFYGIPVQAMTIKARPHKWAMPRQVAMYLCRVYTPHSLVEIGQCFGGRDHSTVAYAVEQVQNMRSTERDFAERLEAVTKIVIDQLKKEEMPLLTDTIKSSTLTKV